MELVQGLRLGDRFKVIGCLGTGTNGRLFLAADGEQYDSLVALRVLSTRTVSANPSLQANLRKLIRIRHEALCAPLDVFENAEGVGVLFEYVDGGNLQDILGVGPLPVPQIIAVLKQLALAVQALHDHGVPHGNIKPSNVLMTADGQVKLADPSLAEHKGRDLRKNDIREIGNLGTFLLQELVRRAPREPDSRNETPRAVWQSLRAIVERAAAAPSTDGYESIRDFVDDLEWIEEEMHSHGRFTAFALVSCCTLFELGALAIFLSLIR